MLGSCHCTVEADSRSTTAELFVIDVDSVSVKPLLTHGLCRSLGLMGALAVVDKFVESDVFKGMSVEHLAPDVLHCLQKHEHIFMHGGVLNNGYVYTIELMPDAKPITLLVRQVPPKLVDQFRDKLRAMEEQGIIHEVREATPWCSPMVIAYKKNNDIRVCQDLWDLNLL